MPVPCKNPRYGYTKDKKVRLTWCKNKVVETKSKTTIDLERQYGKRIHKDKKGYYYNKKGSKVYVKRCQTK